MNTCRNRNHLPLKYVDEYCSKCNPSGTKHLGITSSPWACLICHASYGGCPICNPPKTFHRVKI